MKMKHYWGESYSNDVEMAPAHHHNTQPASIVKSVSSSELIGGIHRVTESGPLFCNRNIGFNKKKEYRMDATSLVLHHF